MKLGLVVNSTAKYHRAHPRARASMAQRCERSPVQVVYGETQSAQDVTRLARECRDEGIDVLAISGGDGTGSLTLSQFARVYGDQPLPTVAFLRGGTMNTVCNGLGVRKGKPLELLDRTLAAVDAASFGTTTADVMVAAGSEYCFLFGIGTLHAFLKEYYAAGAPYPTPLIAGKVLGRGILSAVTGGPYAKRITARVQLEVEVDGRSFERCGYFALAAGTIDEIGLGFSPFYAKEVGAQGFFHVLGWTMSIRQFGLSLPSIWMKKRLADRLGWDLQARSMVVRAPGDGPLEFMADGELRVHEGPLSVELGPTLQIMAL